MTPAVTLVTPVYNQARFLRATIDSVLAQSYPTIDYRVIDDGSTDATPNVIADYGDRVRSDRQTNQGQSAALNRGWREGRGRYLAYLSADDLLAPDAIARMVGALEEDPTLICAYPDSDLIDARGTVLATGVCVPFDLERLIVHGRNPIGPGAVFRAEAFERLGGWRTDVTLGADRHFWARMAALGRIRFVPERLARYRVHGRALSRAHTSAMHARDLLTVLGDYLAGPDTPNAIRTRAPEAWRNAHREVAKRLLRAGAIGAAWPHLRASVWSNCKIKPGGSGAETGSAAADPVPLRTKLRILRAIAG